MVTVPKRKPAARREPTAQQCTACKGTGEVAISVRVGRKRRSTTDQQTGLCLACLGSGQAPTD